MGLLSRRRRYVSASDGFVTLDWVKFTCLSTQGGSITLTIPANVTTVYLTSISYSINGGRTWVKTNNSNDKIVITTPKIPVGSSVYFKGSGKSMGASLSYYCGFSTSSSFSLSGNIMSLLYEDNFDNVKTLTQNYTFRRLFYGAVNIKDISSLKLPATTLAKSCYSGMFTNCTNITSAPALPATTLAQGCYQSMFQDCTSLTTAPDLPAVTLVTSCYNYMFTNCTKLNYIKAMFTTEPSASYTTYWVQNVASSGTFVKNKAATWDVTDTYGIPSGWTVKTATS